MKKVLIANRGEIALRVVRACRDLGIKSAALFSEADEGTLAVRFADERVKLVGNTAKDTYLNIPAIISSAIQVGADAIHPGYGFLSENSEFAEAVEKEGLIFIGPRSETILKMGDKLNARALAEKAKVPLLPGLEVKEGKIDEARKFSKSIGYPVLVKASAGGSGRGIRIVEAEDELEEKIKEAGIEAMGAFGSAVVFIEKYLASPRHVEVQVFGDGEGGVIHIFERDCTLQRRRQKLIEEAPAPRLNDKLRARMLKSACDLASSVRYKGAGTLEFLVEDAESENGKFYFLEMNTRIQVEHPVSEEISGLDLVRMQLEIARGAGLPTQKSFSERGHSMEFRIYSEDPKNNFAPQVGTIKDIKFPLGPGVRIDSWVEAGTKISPYYDALLFKLIVSGQSREMVIERAKRALAETEVLGIKTNIEFFKRVLDQKDFLECAHSISWLETIYKQ
jgi:acetyl-CoA carboxylase biotin carboxylase subunit